MKFDTPAVRNPIDRLKVVGKATPRIDGPLKTTGQAPYAYEQHAAAPGAVYGYIVGAAIAKGRIEAIDHIAASAAPGVLGVITAQNAGKLDVGAFYVARALAGPEVDHYHQAVAMVVAGALTTVTFSMKTGPWAMPVRRCARPWLISKRFLRQPAACR